MPGAAEISDRFSVSRETAERLIVYVQELTRWQGVRNLVGPATLADVWERHIADSLQLASLSNSSRWVDLGSGAGLPGLILAIARPEIHVDLIESDGRKCAFLREVGRATGASVTVWDGRIEVVLPGLQIVPGVVTARALAALPKLLELAETVLISGAVALFPKGRSYEQELTAAKQSWTFTCDILPSRTDPDGRILRISDFGGRRPLQAQIGDPSDHA